MMGHQTRGEALYYYFRLEDQVPENHLLRLIDRHVDLDFIRVRLVISGDGTHMSS
jgi:transposase